MYCLVKYNDLDSSTDDKILYINPDCAIKILLDYIRSEIGKDDEFDLCYDNGEMLFLNENEPETRATEIFRNLTIYYIVLIERTEEGTLSKLTPLISKIINNAVFDRISSRLRRYTSPNKKFAHDSSKKSQRKTAESKKKSGNTSVGSSRKKTKR